MGTPASSLARSTPGGRAFVAAEIDALHAASSSAGLRARGLSSAAMVSDQSEMCRMLRRLPASTQHLHQSGLDHARHAADESVLHVPLTLSDAQRALRNRAWWGRGGGEDDECVAPDGVGGMTRATRSSSASTGALDPPSVSTGWRQPRGRFALVVPTVLAGKLHDQGVARVDASAGVGLLPVLQFGSFFGD